MKMGYYGNMMMMMILGLIAIIGFAEAQLMPNYYAHSCPRAEEIVQNYVHQHILNGAPSLAAPLLRMQFHDCFVRGCDGSVLLDVTRAGNNDTEKLANPNLTLRGFGFIDGVKSLLEAECPGVVSCADIIALTARDSVAIIGGPWWPVTTGRRDGFFSNESEALQDIPPPTSNFTALQASFAKKGLDLKDLVLLSGAHTIGVSICPSFSERLYNFSGRGFGQDPSLDSEYADNLRTRKCTTPTDNTTIVEMDPGSRKTFDLSYYKLLLKRRGLFQSDSALTKSPITLAYVNQLLDGSVKTFFDEFGQAMVKMGQVEVLTGSSGEIRKNCARVN